MTGGDGPLRAIDKLNMARGRITRKINKKYKKKRSIAKKISTWYKNTTRYTYRKK